MLAKLTKSLETASATTGQQLRRRDPGHFLSTGHDFNRDAWIVPLDCPPQQALILGDTLDQGTKLVSSSSDSELDVGIARSTIKSVARSLVSTFAGVALASSSVSFVKVSTNTHPLTATMDTQNMKSMDTQNMKSISFFVQ